MAFAETAELAVKLKLDAAAYERGMKGATAATTNFGRTAGAIGGHIKAGIGSALTNVTRLGIIAGAALGAGLAVQVRSGIDSLQELEKVTAQTNAVLKSTKGVAGESAAAIVALSEKYEDLNATIDNKVIQSGENLLLTFTSIRKQAFEPALLAALNMNQALGGGEGGLQGTILQVGKALQDPIKGITALRRAGVNFSADQVKQIKTLIAHNKLFEAQKLILAELTKEFGGSFAAAGKTATGTFASLGDAVEDIQMNLTRALLPALTEVAKELTKVAKDPAFLKGVEDFGKGLAGAFRNAITFAKQLPWKAIGDGLRTAASAAGALVDAFVKAPDWLKTAVITGWGLNKLTGGALTGIGGDLLKGLGDQFLSRGSPANPMFVKEIGLGGAGAAAGATGLLGKAANVAQKVFIVGMVAEVADLIHGVISPGGGLEGRIAGEGGGLLPADQLSWPFGPKNTPHVDLGPIKNIFGGDSAFTAPGDKVATGGLKGGDGSSHSEDRKIELASIDAIRANTVALRLNARNIEKAWLKTIDPKDIGARSKAVTGHAATPAQIAAIRTRDELHQLKVITEKSQASSAVKLERLRVLAADAKAHGDTKTAKKVDDAIVKMKAKVAAEQVKTTAAVGAGAAGIIGAVQANNSDLNVYVTTNITASDIVTTTVTKERMGPGAGSSNGNHAGNGGP